MTSNRSAAREVIDRYLASCDAASQRALLGDDSVVFWIDWRSEDSEVPEACESVLRTGRLRAETDGEDLVIMFGERRRQVPLTGSEADRHLTLVTLNAVLAPDYEVRLVDASNGSDTLAFVALAAADWQQLATRFGAQLLDAEFPRLRDEPNVFTDPMPRRPQRRSAAPSAALPKRPWWKFW